jgi:hypothetical protein
MKNAISILFVGLSFAVLAAQTDVQTKRPLRHNFNVLISFLVQPRGDVYNYRITKDRLRIDYNCGIINCKDTILYNVKLNISKAEQYYNFVKTLRIDTLRNSYGGGFDGISTLVLIQGDSLVGKSVTTNCSFKHPVINALVNKTNELVDNDKYQFKDY